MQAAFSGTVPCHQRQPDAGRLTQARNSCPLAAELRGSQRIAFRTARSGIGTPFFPGPTSVVCMCSCPGQYLNRSFLIVTRNLRRAPGVIAPRRVYHVPFLCWVFLIGWCCLTQLSSRYKLGGSIRVVDFDRNAAIAFNCRAVDVKCLGSHASASPRVCDGVRVSSVLNAMLSFNPAPTHLQHCHLNHYCQLTHICTFKNTRSLSKGST